MTIRFAAIAVSAFAGTAFAQPAMFMGLGSDGGVRGLSSDGSVAVGRVSTGVGTNRGTVWTSGSGWSFVDAPTGYRSVVFSDVSGDGTIMTGTAVRDNDDQVAFRYTAGSGFQFLDDIGTDNIRASGERISRDGSTIIGTGRDGATRFLLWTTSPAPTTVGPSGSLGAALNADATVATGSLFGTMQAFVWDGVGGVQPIASATGAFLSQSVSDDGSVIVGGARGWRWESATGQTLLPVLPNGANPGGANAVSADGAIVAGGSGTNGAYIWTEAGGTLFVRDVLLAQGVNIGGWSLNTVRDISADGKYLIGDGINPQGVAETWYAFLPEPVPAPGVVGVFGLAGAVISRRRRG